MTTDQPTLAELQRILWAARIDVFCNQWHLTNRAIPRLKSIADTTDDDQLRQAITYTSTALDHMDTLLEDLRTAIDLIKT